MLQWLLLAINDVPVAKMFPSDNNPLIFHSDSGLRILYFSSCTKEKKILIIVLLKNAAMVSLWGKIFKPNLQSQKYDIVDLQKKSGIKYSAISKYNFLLQIITK